MRIAVLMHRTRGQFQEQLRLNAAALSKHQEVKEVVVQMKDLPRSPDAMEIRKVFKGISKLNGTCAGQCNEVARCKCGGQGHIAPQCPST